MKRLILRIIISFLIVGAACSIENVLAAGTGDFLELRSEHFVIKYQEGVSKDYLDKIKKISEQYYRTITQEFNLIRDQLWLWDNRAQVFIAKDKQAYLDRFGCSSWSGACVNYISKIIYTYPDQQRFNSTFVHELTHIILHEYLGRSNIAIWLDEGVAVYIENKYGGGNYQRRLSGMVQMMKNNKHIPIADLFRISSANLHKKSSKEAALFYVESFSIINFFIKRYGKNNFSRFLSCLRHGDSLDRAIAKTFRDCDSPQKLEKEWMKFYLK